MTIPETAGPAKADVSDLSRVIDLMDTDKSNEWTEEIAVLTDIQRQLSAPRITVADLDGTPNEADWIRPGHILDADDVAFIRALTLPGPAASTTEGSDG